MVVGPRIEVKAIEGDALRSYRDDGYLRTDFAVEAVLVHAEVHGCVTKPNESRCCDTGVHGTHTAIPDLRYWTEWARFGVLPRRPI